MEQGEPVKLYIYDLSRGMAKTFSQMLLNKQIDGVWHTSVVVYGTEFYYGHGINAAAPGTTPCGTPVQILDMGRTQLGPEILESLLEDLSERYSPTAYSLFSNNCNNFSDELANLLVGRGIPTHITALPSEVLATPFGQMLQPALAGLERQLGAMTQTSAVLGQQLAEALAASGVAPSPVPPGSSGEEPTSPRTLERGVDAAIASAMIADRAAHGAVPAALGEGGASPRAVAEAAVEAEVRARLAERPSADGTEAEEIAAEALRREAQREAAAAAAEARR